MGLLEFRYHPPPPSRLLHFHLSPIHPTDFSPDSLQLSPLCTRQIQTRTHSSRPPDISDRFSRRLPPILSPMLWTDSAPLPQVIPPVHPTDSASLFIGFYGLGKPSACYKIPGTSFLQKNEACSSWEDLTKRITCHRHPGPCFGRKRRLWQTGRRQRLDPSKHTSPI